MDPELVLYLDRHEVGVEFEVRNIDPQSDGPIEALHTRLVAERADSALVPIHTHKLKTPRTELVLCDDMVSTISNMLTTCLRQDPPETRDLNTVMARCHHYAGRLKRLGSNVSACSAQASSLITTLWEIEARARRLVTESVDSENAVNVTAENGSQGASGGAPGLDNPNITPATVSNANVNPNRAVGTRISGWGTPSAQNRPTPNHPLNKDFNIWNPVEPLLSWNPFPANRSNDRGNLRNSTINQGRQQSERSAHHERQAIYNWRLTFDGEPKGLSVEEFLFRVERLARAEDINLERLPELVHILLRGKAEAWFWLFARKYPNCGWNDLKGHLEREFCTQSTDFEIRKRIESRCQRPGESFSDFRSEVVGLAAKMRRPLGETEIIYILRANMNRRLKDFLLLRPTETVDELRDVCREYEKLWAGDEWYRNRMQQRRSVNAIEDTSQERFMNVTAEGDDESLVEQLDAMGYYSGPGRNNSANMGANRAHQTNYATKPIQPQHLVCWNCEGVGHIFWRCPEEQKRLHCYGCGTANVAKSNCKRCNPLNPAADVSKTGIERPRDQQ